MFAREIKTPETAFLVEEDEELFSVRFITPTGHEIEMCGHGALCATQFLYSKDKTWGEELQLKTVLGTTIFADILDDGFIELTFPSFPPSELSLDLLTSDMVEALGISIDDVTYFGKSIYDYVIEVSTESIVRGLKPDLKALGNFKEVRAFIITAGSESEDCNFVTRVFGPAVGIPEDPVTGSAVCSLAPYWRERVGFNNMCGYQASERGGYVEANHDGSDVVLIRGQAVSLWDYSFADLGQL